MNSDTTYKTSTAGPEETAEFGARIGHLLRGGEVIELAADMGGGKTTLMQGLVAAMGYEGEVPSPTFTISRVYPVRKNIAVYHFDFYRLHGTDVVTNELAEVLDEPSAIVAVEWWGNVGHDLLPPNRVRVTIEPGATHMDRNIKVESLGGAFDYVVAGLKP